MDAFISAEHLHVMTNHLPVVGSLAALVPLFIGLVFHRQGALIAGLITAAVFAGTIPLVMATGEKAAERFDGGPMTGVLDEQGLEWLAEHEQQAEIYAKVAYATAGLAVLGLIVSFKHRWCAVVGWVVFIGCATTTATLGYVANTGGKIRHPEFRGSYVAPLEESQEAPQASDEGTPEGEAEGRDGDEVQ